MLCMYIISLSLYIYIYMYLLYSLIICKQTRAGPSAAPGAGPPTAPLLDMIYYTIVYYTILYYNICIYIYIYTHTYCLDTV